jgi:hypothetical protein
MSRRIFTFEMVGVKTVDIYEQYNAKTVRELSGSTKLGRLFDDETLLSRKLFGEPYEAMLTPSSNSLGLCWLRKHKGASGIPDECHRDAPSEHSGHGGEGLRGGHALREQFMVHFPWSISPPHTHVPCHAMPGTARHTTKRTAWNAHASTHNSRRQVGK